MTKIEFDSNSFCGPSVIAAITGMTTDEADKSIGNNRIPKVSADKVAGVQVSEIEKVLRNAGYQTTYLRAGHTIFYHLSVTLTEPGYYIFHTPKHVVCIECFIRPSDNKKDFMFIDNRVREPLAAAAIVDLQHKVFQIMKVWK